jgi:Holliday junction resolvasome RuvABC endonuclease subunit
LRVLGIDCATKTGWFLVDNAAGKERLIGHGVLDLSRSPWTQIQWLVTHCRDLERLPDVVVIELPYLDKNPVTLRTLAMLAGRFQQAFEAAGIPTELLMATQWQRKILGRFGGKKREDLKKAAVLWARATFGEVLTTDEADAAGIATCVLRERAFANRVKEARCVG